MNKSNHTIKIITDYEEVVNNSEKTNLQKKN